jgi:hypothetical protein
MVVEDKGLPKQRNIPAAVKPGVKANAEKKRKR